MSKLSQYIAWGCIGPFVYGFFFLLGHFFIPTMVLFSLLIIGFFIRTQVKEHKERKIKATFPPSLIGKPTRYGDYRDKVPLR